MKTLMIPAMMVALAAPAVAQDGVWVEKSFHRVHLINGNFVDGALSGTSKSGVELQMQPGVMTIRRDMVQRIEVVKMRSFKETPKAPTIYSTPKSASAAPKPGLPAPQMDPGTLALMETVLARLKKIPQSQSSGVAKELQDIPKAGAYLAYKLPEVSEFSCATIGAILADLRDPDALDYVLQALGSDRDCVVLEALRVLGASGTRAAAPRIRPFLEDNRLNLRIAAMTALQHIGDEDSLENMLDQLRSADDALRMAAINATLDLAVRGGRPDMAERGLKLALQDARGRAGYDLLLAVGRTKQPALWQLTLPFLHDDDAMLRSAAVASIGTLAPKDAIETIVRMLGTETDKRVRFQLARSARLLHSQDAISPLIEWLRSTDQEIVEAAQTALQALTKQSLGADPLVWENWWKQIRPQ